jgi:hypothetical protein
MVPEEVGIREFRAAKVPLVVTVGKGRPRMVGGATVVTLDLFTWRIRRK